MPDPSPAVAQQGGKKILGMNRRTGLIVLVLGAAVIGYILVSRMGSKTGGASGGSGGGYGAPIYGPGHDNVNVTIRDWQGHQPRPPRLPGGQL